MEIKDEVIREPIEIDETSDETTIKNKIMNKVKRGLSAGRVQSVAVKLIVDREEEIGKFIPEEYWNIYVKLLDEKSKKTFEAKFYGKENKKIEIQLQSK